VRIQTLASGLGWPEGPAILADGSVAFVEMYRSQVSVFRTGRGVERLAWTGGGPNATILGSDGLLYVTQNGGVDGPWHAEVPMPPSIQRIGVDGAAEVLLTQVAGVTLRAPNDLVFGPDGRLYFTDPGLYEPAEPSSPGFVLAVDAGGQGEVIAELPRVYPNGIVAEPDGGIVWVESYTRAVKRWRPGGEIVELHVFEDPLAVPDGLELDRSGNLYGTATAADGVHVLSPQGTPIGFLSVGQVPTNCAFGAAGILIVTDGGHTGTDTAAESGSLLAVEVDTVGQSLFPGQLALSGQVS
jgi:gluconolactonase